MKKYNVLLALFLFINQLLFAQNSQPDDAFKILKERGEIYFSFPVDINLTTPGMLDQLSRLISIDKVQKNEVYAYANRKEFLNFLELGINFNALAPPSMLLQPRMLEAKEASVRSTWDFYPTYSAYIAIMNQFASDYPDLCEVVTIATLPSTRQLLCIHINDSLGYDQNEPEFLYTSSIHGDETTGYVLMLHLVDYLLENYGTDDQVTNLVKNMDIWINPLANPDGTYAGGDNSIYGATRYNANSVDLNRNYPDPEDGPHPDGNEYQPETQAFMDFAAGHDFVMSANFHGGAEVLNYPWDTWPRLAADNAWWVYVCRQYVDTVHAYSPSGYMTDLNNGITNGYAWYSISGGRQDYMNYFQRCREVTAEISSVKLLPANQLEAHWEYNYRSLLKFMEQSLYGVTGTVTNAANGAPVPAKVSIAGHDMDNSEVYATLPVGNYHRLLKAGTYDLTFSAFGYVSKTINDVLVTDENTTLVNVQLQQSQNLEAGFKASETNVGVNEGVDFTDLSQGNDIVSWEWTFEGATPGNSADKNPTNILYPEPGEYSVSLTVTNAVGSQSSATIEEYIKVYETYSMANDSTVYTCGAVFYDSGGKNGNYTNDEQRTMTFISYLESGYLWVNFEMFNTEYSFECVDDYLEIYDGKNDNSPLIGRYCGSQLPESFVSTNIDGAVTFRFVSNSDINDTGWKAIISCDTNVGIPNHTESFAVKIYPNPASKQVNIESELFIEEITLRSMDGKLIFSALENSEKILLNLENTLPGLYILETISGHFINHQKLVVR